jgi:ATP synthase in type III secretion protein N
VTLRHDTPLRSDYLAAALDTALSDVDATESRGRVLDALGTLVKATGLAARIGDLCEFRNPGAAWRLRAEVIGVSRQATLLMPFGDLDGISAQTEVVNLGRAQTVKVGPALLGRVLDGLGEPRDSLGPLGSVLEYPVHATAPDPLTRRRVERVLQTGVRAIDGLLTCGEGQRVGIFAPAGTGKSSLLAMIARGTSADVIVVGLIGERGREVGEFLDGLRQMGASKHSVCVAATSDRPAVERIKAANVATTIAEYFRDQGKSVLLLVDSITRYARALREIALASGEPPARRGYPPSTLAALPRLFERAGQAASGSITAFYTVLVDDDEAGDPIGEEVRATLDGHIVLSNQLAAAGHYPAIDVLTSRSRVMVNVTSHAQQSSAMAAIEMLAKYDSVHMLVQIGEYKSGSDAAADRALRCREGLLEFLRQGRGEAEAFDQTVARLKHVVSA